MKQIVCVGHRFSIIASPASKAQFVRPAVEAARAACGARGEVVPLPLDWRVRIARAEPG